MHAHENPQFQYSERCYRVVTVSREGKRTVVSRHASFLAAERSRKMIPSMDGLELRIETAVVEAMAAVGSVVQMHRVR